MIIEYPDEFFAALVFPAPSLKAPAATLTYREPATEQLLNKI